MNDFPNIPDGFAVAEIEYPHEGGYSPAPAVVSDLFAVHRWIKPDFSLDDSVWTVSHRITGLKIPGVRASFDEAVFLARHLALHPDWVKVKRGDGPLAPVGLTKSARTHAAIMVDAIAAGGWA